MMDRLKDFFNTHVASQSAYLETAIAAAIQIGGTMGEFVIGGRFPGIPNWPGYLSLSSAVATILVLALTRRRQNMALANQLFVLNACFIAFVVYLRAPYYAEFADKWVPYQTNKLACLVSALLAPSFLSGLVAIAVYAFGAVFSYWGLSSEIRANLAVGEPAATIVFTMAGILTLISRYRRIQIEHRMVKLEAETRAAERFARTVLRIRDMMNTPLQVIEFSVTILRNGFGGHDDALKGLDNATRRLAELNSVLKEHQDGEVPS